MYCGGADFDAPHVPQTASGVMSAPFQQKLSQRHAARRGSSEANECAKGKANASDGDCSRDLQQFVAVPLCMSLLCVACGIFFGMPLRLSHIAFHSVLLGVTPLLASAFILFEALRVRHQTFWQFISATPAIKLPTASVYGISRHAGLAALLLMLASGSICINSWWGCICAGMTMAFWHFFLVPQLDQRDAARFGLAHKLHCQRTATWI